MRIRKYWAAFALAHCALPLGWAVKLGEPAPDIALRDCSGADVRLSAYHEKKHVALLAVGPGTTLAPAVLADTCRGVAALDTVVLLLAGEAPETRPFLQGAPPATLLLDPKGVVRRVLLGRTLTGLELAGFVKLWQSGKAVFRGSCARCHGPDGDREDCGDVHSLVGIGRRLSEAEIRERLRIGVINDEYVMIRETFYTRPDVEAIIVYVAGL